MRILVTGRGTSGSWAIRGEQLGAAIGADVVPNASLFRGYDRAILVKRPRPHMVAAIREARVPLVWDVVDSWPQPHGNEWDRATCLDWLRTEVKAMRPAGIVAATQAMAADCAEFGVPVLALPHHARPGQRRNPLRETVRTVGYEGGEQYLGAQRAELERACARRGWTFMVNPAELAALDIVVALRERAGYAPRHWKSNVKLANAQGSRTPSVVNREAGYLETAGPLQWFADTPAEFEQSFDALADFDQRRQQVASYRAPELSAVAIDYLQWLRAL